MTFGELIAICLHQLFWLSLAIPGLAILARTQPGLFEQGLLAVLARSYLFSFALLTPVSIIGQVLRWPLWTLSIACVASVLFGLWSLSRTWRGQTWPRLRFPGVAALLAGAALLADFVLGSFAGAHLEGDAGYHIAHVRMLYELGLSSLDPLGAPEQLNNSYPMSLYHGLIACAAQLTGSDPGLAWLQTWPFDKLLTAAGSYTLAYRLYRERRWAWLAAAVATFWYSSYAILPYPNTLACAAVLPIAIAAVLEVLEEPVSYKGLIAVALSSLLLGQLHSLTSFFLPLCATPVLLAMLLYRVWRRLPGRLPLVAAFVALACSPGLIYQAAGRLDRVLLGVTDKTERVERAALLIGPKADHFNQLESGQVMIKWQRLAGPDFRNLYMLVALVVGVIFVPGPSMRAFAALIAVAGAWLIVPSLCTQLLLWLGKPWAVARLNSMFNVALCALVPAALLHAFVVIAERIRPHAAAKVWVECIGFAGALSFGLLLGMHGEPWTMPNYLASVSKLSALESARNIAARHDFLARNIPVGQVVMAPTQMDYALPMHHHCRAFVLSENHGAHGLSDAPERRREVKEFYGKMNNKRRLAMLRKYHIDHVYCPQALAWTLARDLPEHIAGVDFLGDVAIVRLHL